MNCCAWSSILSFSSSIADIRRPNSFKELKNIRYWLSDAFPYYFLEYNKYFYKNKSKLLSIPCNNYFVISLLVSNAFKLKVEQGIW